MDQANSMFSINNSLRVETVDGSYVRFVNKHNPLCTRNFILPLVSNWAVVPIIVDSLVMYDDRNLSTRSKRLALLY